jgi:hypothetical protein
VTGRYKKPWESVPEKVTLFVTGGAKKCILYLVRRIDKNGLKTVFPLTSEEWL